VIGAIMSDCTKNTSITLSVKDLSFANEFAKSLHIVTGREYEVRRGSSLKYIVTLKGSPLRYIIKSGLWKVVAYAYPKEFLQGLFDGDGGISICITKRQFKVIIFLTNSNLELLKYVKQLLMERYGIKSKIKLSSRAGVIRQLPTGRKFTTKRCCWTLTIQYLEDVIKFYKYIGFKIQRKQERLEDVAKIIRIYKSNRDRIRAWLRKYVMGRNHRWIRRLPSPDHPHSFLFSLNVVTLTLPLGDEYIR